MAGQSVRIGTREIKVEQSPLSGRGTHFKFALNQSSQDQLTLLPHRGVRVLGWIFCILSSPLLGLGVFGFFKQFVMIAQNRLVGADVVTVLVLLALGAPLLLLGLRFLGPRFRFDPSAGEMTIRHFARTRRRPLTDILAVQVLESWIANPNYGTRREGFQSNQLNLILDDPATPRLFLSYNQDTVDIARKGKVLAEFLNIPLLATPKIQALIQADAAGGQLPGKGRLRRVSDAQLEEPYRTWIDRTQPLPEQVRLLPRSVNIIYDLGMFLILGTMFIVMAWLGSMMFWDVIANDRARGEWGSTVGMVIFDLVLAIVPLILLRRVWITFWAFCDLKRSALRQGIFVGSEGVVVRMEPDGCYPIPLDRFVTARITETVDYNDPTLFAIDTLDGTVDFFTDRISVPPAELIRHVEALRKTGKLPPVISPAPAQQVIQTDPTEQWPVLNEPLPVFDMASGALGSLRVNDDLDRAKFLGRPDRVEHIGDRWMSLDYTSRGFQLDFDNNRFSELTCRLALPENEQPEPGQGCCRPRLSGGVELTPEMSVAQVQHQFGPPEATDDYAKYKNLRYSKNGFNLDFEFEQSTGRLLNWAVLATDE